MKQVLGQICAAVSQLSTKNSGKINCKKCCVSKRIIWMTENLGQAGAENKEISMFLSTLRKFHGREKPRVQPETKNV